MPLPSPCRDGNGAAPGPGLVTCTVCKRIMLAGSFKAHRSRCRGPPKEPQPPPPKVVSAWLETHTDLPRVVIVHQQPNHTALTSSMHSLIGAWRHTGAGQAGEHGVRGTAAKTAARQGPPAARQEQAVHQRQAGAAAAAAAFCLSGGAVLCSGARPQPAGAGRRCAKEFHSDVNRLWRRWQFQVLAVSAGRGRSV